MKKRRKMPVKKKYWFFFFLALLRLSLFFYFLCVSSLFSTLTHHYFLCHDFTFYFNVTNISHFPWLSLLLSVFNSWYSAAFGEIKQAIKNLITKKINLQRSWTPDNSLQRRSKQMNEWKRASMKVQHRPWPATRGVVPFLKRQTAGKLTTKYFSSNCSESRTRTRGRDAGEPLHFVILHILKLRL